MLPILVTMAYWGCSMSALTWLKCQSMAQTRQCLCCRFRSIPVHRSEAVLQNTSLAASTGHILRPWMVLLGLLTLEKYNPLSFTVDMSVTNGSSTTTQANFSTAHPPVLMLSQSHGPQIGNIHNSPPPVPSKDGVPLCPSPAAIISPISRVWVGI
jgi:hypothetical protein